MDNRNVRITSEGLTLVPYTKDYVETYHKWMTRPDLLELTCSEPLTLEEEERNQKEWLESGDKMTFIIIANGTPVGDCNVFLHDEGTSAEVEIMIAELSARRHGHAQRVVIYLMKYVLETLPGVETFRAKILCRNDASLRLFKKLGFVLERKVEVFEEEHYKMERSDAMRMCREAPCCIDL
eukprot:TRINITY_DN27395_c0_g1_i1.p1 TRINITY_DN27395_c0_g1~~TRINITY_DN27395_c0_g1_i1.p1  ORF type:complete len:195 (+),score=55.56 TRINITY_DN27395_c0_g1_i1:44-586(+)